MSGQDDRLARSPNPKAASYFSSETLRDGRPFIIRALRPEDRDGLLGAIGRTSTQSLYRRFFAVRRYFSEKETEYFLKIDFVDHVALIAEIEENRQPAIIGGGRYIVVGPGRAELAFAVIDEYQGQGVGGALMRSLCEIARDAGLAEFIAEVLPENSAMIGVFQKSGLKSTSRRNADTIEITLKLDR